MLVQGRIVWWSTHWLGYATAAAIVLIGLAMLVEHHRAKDDSDPKELACYGLLVRQRALANARLASEQLLLRFVEGREVSSVTIDFLSWCSQRLPALGKTIMYPENWTGD